MSTHELPVEAYFLRYAFPCTYVIRQRGGISEADFERLEQHAALGTAPSRKVLEGTYKPAFRRIRKLAAAMGKDCWDYEVIRRYWRENHNRVIDAREGGYADSPPEFCEFCKVREAKVAEKHEGFLVVTYDGGKVRAVSAEFVPGAKKGSPVTIHHGYAVEVLEA